MAPAWRRAHACSGVTTRLILAFVERELGRDAVTELLAKADLPASEQELRNEDSWFSFDFKIALWDAAAEITGDRCIAERVGGSALEFTVALGLKRALRALGSPDFVFRNVARANSKFNWAHTLEMIDRGRGCVHLRYRDLADVGYHHYDCDYTIGLLRTVPQLFGLPAARVAHPMCGARGDDHCEFAVQWVAGRSVFKRAALAGGASGAILAAAGALTDPILLAPGAGLLGIAASAAGVRGLLAMRGRVVALETRVRDQDLAAEAQLASLAALSTDLKLDEVLDRIMASATSAVTGARFVLLIAEAGGMRADRHSGLSPEAVTRLERWAETGQETLTEGPIVLDDLSSEPALISLSGRDQVPLGSVCAAPLVFRERLLGVLIALAPGAGAFLPQDVLALETYAVHAAIALSNARLVAQLEREAAEDPLTGLANKRAFELAYAAELSRTARTDEPMALIELDIDHFKEINDSYGHPFGDQVLVSVAAALRSAVRGHDMVARLGGEEFALLLPGATIEDAQLIAERVRALVAQIELPHGILSSSAGVAASGGAGAAEGLFEAADRALYDAKRQGRGRTQLAA